MVGGSSFSDENEFEHLKYVSNGIGDTRSHEASSIESDLGRLQVSPPFIIIKLSNNEETSSRSQPLTGVWGIEESEQEDVLDEDDINITDATMGSPETQVDAIHRNQLLENAGNPAPCEEV